MESLKIFLTGIIVSVLSVVSITAQDILLLTENFETGGPSFTLNGDGVGTNTGDNQWIINNAYTGDVNYPNTTPQSNTNGGTISFAPTSNYLHIQDQPSGVLNNNYDPSAASDRFAYMTFGICTYAIEEVHFSFFYLSEGSPTAYGEIYYSLDGGPWTQFGLSIYNSMSLWQYVDITDPLFSNVGSLRFGFRWQNDAGSPPYSQSFSIDDINIVGSYSEIDPVEINVLSVSPNPVCQGSFVTIEYQLSDTLCDGNYEIELSNSSGFFNGSFGSWVMPINYPTTTGFVTVQIPNNAQVGDCYKFRISRLSPPPEITGTASGCFEIIECPNVITTLQPVVTMDTNAVCIGSAIDIPFYSTGVYAGSNDYICELSDVDGTFPSNPETVGSSDDNENYDPLLGDLPGSVSGLIPVVEPGCNYYLRIISTNPDAIGSVWGPFCIAECDLTTNNNEDIEFCVNGCAEDPDGENMMIDVDVNTWDGIATYGAGNIFHTQLLSSMDFSQIGSDGILGSVAATGSTQLPIHIPCKDSLPDYGIPLGMNYMRVVATNSSTPDNALGSLIRVTIGAYTDVPQIITAYSYPNFIPQTSFCVGETVALLFEPYDYFANSTYMWTCNGINGGNPFVSPSGANSNSLYVIVGGAGTLNFSIQETNYGCVSPWTPPMSITVLGDPNVNITGPSTVCQLDTVSFQVNFYPDTYYSWSTNAPPGAIAYQDTSNNEMNIAFNELGNYTFDVGVLNLCGSGDDDISITVIAPPEALASPDTSLICIDESTTLNVQTGANYDYLWFEDGEEIGNSNSVIVSPIVPTSYVVEVEGTGGCTDTDTVFVDVLFPEPATLLYDSLCPGGLIDIDLTSPVIGLYEWSTGSNSSLIMVSDTGTYELSVASSAPCPEYYEFIVLPLVPDSAILLIDSVCPGGGGNAPINLVADQVGDYYWSTGSQLPQILVNDTGIYVLQIVMPDSLCPRTLQWSVVPDTCYAPPELFFYVPNSFSPNNDDINDVFGPVFSDPSLLSEYRMMIFDRWGEVVFQSSDVNKKWMGDFRTGEYFVHDGAYVWMIEYQQTDIADPVKEVGHVVMLR